MADPIDLKKHIRSIPDFPKPGILFYDISTLLAHPKAWHATIEQMAETVKAYKPDVLAGIESRGFLLAAPLAIALGTGFVMLRKKGKLPGITVRHTYALEYGTDTLQIHADALQPGMRVLVCDDLLATGGTAAATIELCRRLDADVVGAAFAVELAFLGGRDRLSGVDVQSAVAFDE